MQLEGLCDLLPEEVCISAAGQQTFPVSQCCFVTTDSMGS